MIPQQVAMPRMHTQRDFFSSYSFDTLIMGAARLRPQAVALADRGTSVPFDLLAGHASALARLLADSGLRPGERVLLTGGAEVSLVIAIVAALRGGFEPALAPLGTTWSPCTIVAPICIPETTFHSETVLSLVQTSRRDPAGSRAAPRNDLSLGSDTPTGAPSRTEAT